MCEIKLKFNDCTKPVILRDKDLIKKIPILTRAIEGEDPDWETKDVVISTPLEINFPKYAAEFIFAHIRKYVSPRDTREEILVDEFYPEAGKKTLPELKQILELANFMECTPFMHCIAFVIGRQLDSKSVDEIADYLGVVMEDEVTVLARPDGWLHAPAAIFNNNN